MATAFASRARTATTAAIARAEPTARRRVGIAAAMGPSSPRKATERSATGITKAERT
jgi:hypothetical protein